MTKREPHSIAISSFNSNHSSYDIFRPSFTPLIVQPFLVELELGRYEKSTGLYEFDTNKKIVEIACGTGKFTKNLVDNGWTSNLTVVEPSIGMLETFRRNFPQIKNIQASSFNTTLENTSVDAIIIAQAFHWFADEVSLKEFSRILKPRGKLGLIWNFDSSSPSQKSNADDCKFYNASSRYFNTLTFKGNNEQVLAQYFANQKWNEEVTKYIYSFDINVPQYRHGKWKQILLNNPYFESHISDSFALYDQEINKDDVWKYWETRSYITDLSPDKKLEIKKHVEDLIKKYAQNSSYVDENKRLLIKPMATHAVVISVKNKNKEYLI
ncbi:hypothetical protein KGF56_000863 [Candida oxycetoniae]|uniref:Methyltransferase type 11 domain-containing protein n=1 Tax=Candida oxycetoniae TaxID=497107 RepID=A0AAI9WZH9_9ASCO|nr:uncharacterized protein KGF56_000863 [Candida oxycetoniae]KAI3406382.1 hypothetical protein KGF56_000863 [Candida oxycetoniae]